MTHTKNRLMIRISLINTIIIKQIFSNPVIIFINFVGHSKALGNEGMGISIYAILLLSIALLFYPAQQGYGFFTLSPELNDNELIELNKLKQIVLAEQTRDEIFVVLEQQNPYLETASNVPEYFEKDEEKSIDSFDRSDENFQLVKDEQISIAEKKCKEILGGKIISNSLNNEPINKKSTHEFEMNDEMGHMDRSSDEFKDYKLLQISIAEDFRDNNWGKTMYQMKLSNPYLNEKPTSIDSSIEEHKISEQKLPYRQSEKFKNAIIKQIAFAEYYRNKLLDNRIAGNPYLDENLIQNIDENKNESFDVSTRNIIITGKLDPTYVSEESEISFLGRESKEFGMIQALEIEIAQTTLNEMGLLPNSEEMTDEIISLTNENKKLNNPERDDQGFEFFKNKQIDAAEKKLMEILGHKNIHNFNH